jgi:putative ABC transport system permease protein
MAQALGLDDPVGAEITSEGFDQSTVRVIGVVNNFNRQNARLGASPLVLTPVVPGGLYRMMSVKVAPGTTDPASRVQKVWKAALPQAPFVHTFVDDRIAEGYSAEQQTRRIVAAGAGLALFVALLGLVGLTGFTVRRRTKEIGIRKALGASAASVVRLLSTDVAKLVGAAFLAGAPAAYLLARWWLQDFAMRIDLTPWPFLAAGLAALLLALAAVSIHTLRAAHLDPATTLRDE